MTAEPVAYTDAEELETLRKGTFADMFTPHESYKADQLWIPLYTTPPAQLLRPVELPARATAETFGGLSLAKAYGWNACLAEVQRLDATAQPVSDGLYRIANHIAGAKNSLPQEWQDWAEEIESDLRKLAAASGGQDD
ncbi:hypothetical protein [Pantoea sp. AG702]|uniref:hypothetical protein n=1 Tax=Pantoea sp. AG702 TaxID=2183907 RepID=UPI000D7154C5|nr:hypothetical protein [Pantoea sp. AG702]PWW13655.1 hypothetical protein DFO57_106249 [Pantoea sp. AG702]